MFIHILRGWSLKMMFFIFISFLNDCWNTEATVGIVKVFFISTVHCECRAKLFNITFYYCGGGTILGLHEEKHSKQY